MAVTLSNFRVEQGIQLVDPNTFAGATIIFGSDAAPGGDTGLQDDAEIGSLYLDTNGELWHKEADANADSDWKRFVDERVYSLFGGDVDYDDITMDTAGSYTGGILTNNTIKGNLQELSNAIEALAPGELSEAEGTTGTPVVMDSCLVDSCLATEWEVVAVLDSDPTRKAFLKVTAMHDDDKTDPTATGDAANIDLSKHTKLKTGINFTNAVTVALSGTAATQTMDLTVSGAAGPDTVSFYARRTDLRDPT